MGRLAAICALMWLAACDLPPPDPAVVANDCEDRARAAQGPTGSVTVGTNNRSGNFGEINLGVSSDFIRGRDPVAVYEECVIARTGEAPIRPPVLRRI